MHFGEPGDDQQVEKNYGRDEDVAVSRRGTTGYSKEEAEDLRNDLPPGRNEC